MKAHGCTEAAPISVFLVDDHPILLRGLQNLIEDHEELSLAGVASIMEEAERAIASRQPKVVVMDLYVGGQETLPLIARVQRPGITAVLTFSASRGLNMIDSALRVGVLGHVGKHEPPSRIVEGILAVAAGRMFLDAGIARELLRWRSNSSAMPEEVMTPREREVYQLIGEGLTTPEMAARLGLSTKTIEAHKENLKRKLGAKSSSELRKWAIGVRRGASQ